MELKTLRQLGREHGLGHTEVGTVAALCDVKPIVLGRSHGIRAEDEAKMLAMLTKLAKVRRRQRARRIAATATASPR